MDAGRISNVDRCKSGSMDGVAGTIRGGIMRTQKERDQMEMEIHDKKEGQYEDYIKHKSRTAEENFRRPAYAYTSQERR